MWPAPFEYHAARSADHAVELLGRLPSASVLAGGLTLVPAMRRRRVRPANLVDINPAPDLAMIGLRDGMVSVGAGCRQADLLRWARTGGRAPLLAEALSQVGTGQTRQRGTVAGIVANGDPATQLAAVCAVLGAGVWLRDGAGDHLVPAWHVFANRGLAGLTGRPALLTAVEFPTWSPGDGHAFLQCGRRAVGSVIGGVAARVRLDRSGMCVRADVAPFLPGHDGSRLPAVGERLTGTGLGDADLAEAADIAACGVRPDTDVLAGSDYRRHLVRVLVRRALGQARTRARKGPN